MPVSEEGTGNRESLRLIRVSQVRRRERRQIQGKKKTVYNSVRVKKQKHQREEREESLRGPTG